MPEENKIKTFSTVEIEKLIQTTDIQSLIKIARAVVWDLCAVIKKQWLEANEDAKEEDFEDEDYDVLLSAIPVLEDYIH